MIPRQRRYLVSESPMLDNIWPPIRIFKTGPHPCKNQLVGSWFFDPQLTWPRKRCYHVPPGEENSPLKQSLSFEFICTVEKLLANPIHVYYLIWQMTYLTQYITRCFLPLIKKNLLNTNNLRARLHWNMWRYQMLFEISFMPPTGALSFIYSRWPMWGMILISNDIWWRRMFQCNQALKIKSKERFFFSISFYQGGAAVPAWQKSAVLVKFFLSFSSGNTCFTRKKYIAVKLHE